MPYIRDFNPTIPQSVENIILRATAKKVSERYATVEEMREDLLECRSPKMLDVERIQLDDDPVSAVQVKDGRLEVKDEPRAKGSRKKIVIAGIAGALCMLAAVLAALVFVLRKDLALLDVITLGKAQAVNLGVDYDRCIRRLLLGVTLAIAVATAVVGPISFMGLIIANLSRQLLKTYRHSQLIAGSALFGMLILVAGQLIVEHVYTYAIPISVFITVGGGLYFLYLLLTKRRV